MRNITKTACAFTIIVSLALSLFGCGAPVDTTPNDKLNIITTNFPPYDFARQIAGEYADVTMLLAPGQESHTYEPTPKDIVAIQNADLFIAGGGESDQWVKTLIDSAQLDETKILFMMDCIEPLSEEHTDDHHHDEQDHSDYYTYDEHVWTSPVNAIEICRQIAERLILRCPQKKQQLSDGLAQYIVKLEALHNDFSDVADNSNKKTLIFGDRFPFRYFADQYGLSYYAAFPGCSGETEPDAATMKFLIDKTKQDEIPVILYTELSNQKIADAICESTGAKKALFHSCHSVTKDEFTQGETYISLMQKNLSVLKEALS